MQKTKKNFKSSVEKLGNCNLNKAIKGIILIPKEKIIHINCTIFSPNFMQISIDEKRFYKLNGRNFFIWKSHGNFSYLFRIQLSNFSV